MLKNPMLIAFLLGFFPLVPFLFKPFYILMIALIVLAFHRKKWKWKPLDFYFSALFFIYILGLITTQNMNYGIQILLRLSPLLLFVIVYKYQNINQRFKTQFYQSFILSLALYIVIYLSYLGYNFYINDFEFGKALSYNIFDLYGFNEHPIYVSYFLSFSILVLIDQAVFKQKILRFGLLITLSFVLFYLSRKGPILSLLSILSLYTIWKFRSLKKQNIMLFIVFIALLSPLVLGRIQEMIFSMQDQSTLTRIQLWEEFYDLLDNTYFLGYGTGDAKDILNELLQKGIHERLNLHNQYLDISLKTGIAGLLLFVWSQLQLGRNLYKRKIILGSLMFIYFVLNMFTESILERQDGVIFYAMVIGLYLYQNDEV